MKKFIIKILTKLLYHFQGERTQETEDDNSSTVVFCSPVSAEDLYKESDSIETFIKKIEQKQ